jgi:hypothetical protein
MMFANKSQKKEAISQTPNPRPPQQPCQKELSQTECERPGQSSTCRKPKPQRPGTSASALSMIGNNLEATREAFTVNASSGFSEKSKKNNSRLYSIWTGMKQRCLNPAQRAFKYYGGKGITTCERWFVFENFSADMRPSYRDGLTTHRIDHCGNYEPENCQWLTREEHAKKPRSRNRATQTSPRQLKVAALIAMQRNREAHNAVAQRNRDARLAAR